MRNSLRINRFMRDKYTKRRSKKGKSRLDQKSKKGSKKYVIAQVSRADKGDQNGAARDVKENQKMWLHTTEETKLKRKQNLE